MAEVHSLGIYRVFRDKSRSLVTDSDYERNHEEAVLFTLSTLYIHNGFTKEEALLRAKDELRILKQQSSQEGFHGTHAHTQDRTVTDRER